MSPDGMRMGGMGATLTVQNYIFSNHDHDQDHFDFGGRPVGLTGCMRESHYLSDTTRRTKSTIKLELKSQDPEGP